MRNFCLRVILELRTGLHLCVFARPQRPVDTVITKGQVENTEFLPSQLDASPPIYRNRVSDEIVNPFAVIDFTTIQT